MSVIGSNLKRIRLLKGLSLKEAGNLLGMSATAVAKYEKGEIKPNSQKIIEFAGAYDVKAVELIKSYNMPKMQFTSFRKKKRLKGQNLELLKDIIQNEVAKYLEVINMNGLNKNSIKLNSYECNSLDDAEKAADKFRNDIDYSLLQPMYDLINTLENLGVLIIKIENDGRFDDFDGLSEYVEGIPVIVLLDGIADGARQRFTIAHELGHLLLKFDNNKLDGEKLANRFASSLLMPKKAVINEFGVSRKNISLYELIAFKEEYRVSIAATLYRLRELNVISHYTYKNYIIKLNKRYGKKEEPAKVEEEKTFQFKKLVYKLEVDNIITLSKACELLGVSAYEYDNENNNY